MARMFPSPLPDAVRDDPRRAAECLVYDALAARLPDSVAVFYSVPLLASRADGGARDAELDFVVADSARGLLVLEVKGGAIGFDGATGRWTSTDRYGAVHEIHDPIEQARHGQHELLRQAGKILGWGPAPVCGAYAVAFPDVQPQSGSIRLDLTRAMLVCAEDFRWLPEKVEAIFRHWHPSPVASGLDAHRLRLLEETLAPRFTLRRALAATVREGEDEILRLTEEQFDRLDMLSRHHRARICGGAGTGKTVLALEKARRLVAAGNRTLLTCYNRPLADHLRRCAGDSSLVVKTFLQLCYEIGQTAGLDLPDPAGPPPPQDYFESALPNALDTALTRLPDERFDAIVVDEGQDFRPQWWWLPLQLALADPDCGILYIFDDDNQRIYTEASGIPGDLPVFPLTKNLRNTRAIHAVARPLLQRRVARRRAGWPARRISPPATLRLSSVRPAACCTASSASRPSLPATSRCSPGMRSSTRPWAATSGSARSRAHRTNSPSPMRWSSKPFTGSKASNGRSSCSSASTTSATATNCSTSASAAPVSILP